MNVQDLKIALEENPNIVLLDVREPHEYQICKIEQPLLIPISQFTAHIQAIPDNKDLVVYCHHGIRSAMVVNYLLKQGFTRVENLEGGIDQWAIHVDNSMTRY